MTREEAKEFGLNILHGIVARNEKSDSSYASLVKEAIDAITEPSLPSNLDEAAKKCVTSIIYEQGLYDGDFLIPVCEDIFKAGAEWLDGQGINYEAIISADKTIPVLPMKDVFDMGLDYGDKVIVQIRKKD